MDMRLVSISVLPFVQHFNNSQHMFIHCALSTELNNIPQQISPQLPAFLSCQQHLPTERGHPQPLNLHKWIYMESHTVQTMLYRYATQEEAHSQLCGYSNIQHSQDNLTLLLC